MAKLSVRIRVDLQPDSGHLSAACALCKEGDNGDIGVFVGDPSKQPKVSSSEALVRVQDVRLVGEELVLVKLVLEVGEVGETGGVALGRMTANTLALGQ